MLGHRKMHQCMALAIFCDELLLSGADLEIQVGSLLWGGGKLPTRGGAKSCIAYRISFSTGKLLGCYSNMQVLPTKLQKCWFSASAKVQCSHKDQ